MSLTGNSQVDLVLTAAALFGWVLIFRILYAVRQGIIWNIKAVIVSVVSYSLMVAAVLPTFNISPPERDFLALAVAGVAVACMRPRSRYIPAATRRNVISRDLKGEKYDGRKHHIDHVWPHSKGGSNTADNLRVIDRKKNLKKGALRRNVKG